ncbi:MAG TPA: alpha/beta hydrolase [Gemmataceae bacterium]|nr:alpha/beta hydrolase [Gemmataceae bacterium]
MHLVMIGFVVALLFYAAVTTIAELGESGFVDSDGVKIHYVTRGTGPLAILLHGFPDFHYTWRHQTPALSKQHQVVALDLRGFNLSDHPKGVENYAMDKLLGDVDAVISYFKKDKAVLIGHDWGGIIAWSFAMTRPAKIERLIAVNVPHPKGLQRELANNPQQQKNSEYARNFQEDDAEHRLTPELLSMWVKDATDRQVHVEAMRRSSVEGMLNYYKANYPRPPYKEEGTFPPVRCPVLMFHGLEDPYLLPGALDGTWNWVDNDLTLVTVPKAGHWVHHDAASLVTERMTQWLSATC